MKPWARRLLPAACCLLLLSGCGGERKADAEQQAYALRDRYEARAACSGSVTLTADYGQRVYDYQLDFSWSGTDGLTVTVVEPEMVAGVTATVTEGSSQLTFDGAVLETGDLGADGLSPLSAIPRILSDVREQYIGECCLTELEGQSALQMTCRDPESPAAGGTEAVLWLEPDSGALLQAELYEDGYRVIFCRFDSFAFDG